MPSLDRLDVGDVDAVAALCGRALADAPSRDELAAALFSDGHRAVVRGDPTVGVVATCEEGGGGFVKLLAVDPAHRRQGYGRALLDAAEADLAHLPSITVGADAPYWLFPGVETSEIALLYLLERRHYQRRDATFNMRVELDAIPSEPGGGTVATATGADRAELETWCAQHWPHWGAEALRALDRGTLVVARDAEGISAIAAYDVNRAGTVGPVAVRPALLGRGAGVGVLLGALHRMRASGHREVEIAWVGPIVPYARVGAVVSRVFFVYRKDLR
jgi:GNAT superfamily N-acetyltransferase